MLTGYFSDVMSNRLYPAVVSAATILIMGLACNSGPTATPDALPTAIPVTATLAATPMPPTILIEQEMDCSGGPGDEYSLIATFRSGEEVRVVGKDDYGEYWIVIDPGSQKGCWIGRENTSAQGETDYLPNLVPPPTPMAAALAAPENFRLVQVSCSVVQSARPIRWEISVVLAWDDSENDVDGYRLYRDGILVANPDKDIVEYKESFLVRAEEDNDITYKIEAIRYGGGASEASEISVSYVCK